MRVTAIVPAYPPMSRVGAWLSTHECLADLVRHGHQVQVYTTFAREAPYVHDGVHVDRCLKGPTLTTAVALSDVVVSHCGDTGLAAELAAKWGKPNVRMAHGRILDAEALDGAALVVFNSHTLASSAPCPSPSIVVHPPVFAGRHATTPGDRVTLVNLSDAKGGDLFWRLARSMPDVSFLGVLGAYGRQVRDRFPNVEVIPTTDDMPGDVWSRTRVLLMPSEHETWGMAAIEAAASGIPTIAHPTPGLVESLGAAGTFVDREEPDGWIAAIRALLTASTWAAASARAFARSAELDPRPDLDRFRSTVEALTHAGAQCA